MAEPAVKRSYSSPRRETQAARTRARIRAAAARLFVRDGYATTSIRAVAAEAGVAERTVYATYAGKLEIYMDAVAVAVGGDDQDLRVAERPEVHAVLSETDPHRVVADSVALGTQLLDRAGDLIFVGIEAEAADPELRRIGEESERATYRNQKAVVQHLADLGALRPGLDVRAATDVWFALASPHTHRLLRRRRRWSSARYQQWLTETLTHQLLRS